MKKRAIHSVVSALGILAVLALALGCAPAATVTTTTPAITTTKPAVTTPPPVATTVPPVTTTAPPATTTAPPVSYPIAVPKTRFKIATTTSLYDTGLWAYLEPLFEKYENVELDIVYAGTGAAINQGKSGNVDAVIVHDPDQEKTFVSDGFGINRRSFAYNYFIIAGPSSDPAGIKGLDPVAAFKKIAQGASTFPNNIRFVSRGDGSGTHGAEKRLWADAGYVYADIQKSGTWYREAGQGMGPTLTMANELSAYVLCDGSTFTSYKGKIALLSLVDKAAASSLNIYNAYAISTDKVKTANLKVANDFINWLISADVQKIIGLYGVKEFGGPLFNPISDGGCTYPACPNLADNMKPIP